MTEPLPPDAPLPRRPPLDEHLRRLQTERSCPKVIARRTIGLLQTVHDLLPQTLGPTSPTRHPGGLDAPSIICRALEAALSLHDAMVLPSDPDRLEAGRRRCANMLEECVRLSQEHGTDRIRAVLAAEADLAYARVTLDAVVRGQIAARTRETDPDEVTAERITLSLPLLRRVARALALVLPSRHRDDWIEERISDLHRLPRGRRLVYVVQMAGAVSRQAMVIRRGDREAV